MSGVAAEAARLNALRDLNLLDTPPSESFDRITRMAGKLFDLPIAAVSLTDSDRQWFKSRIGVAHGSIPRDSAPCAEVAESRRVLVIEDLLTDPRYADSILAKSGIRFYAGAPLTTSDGYGLGAMCVLGTSPRQVSGSEVGALRDLALMVMAQIELQHAFGRLDPISGLPNRVQFIEDLEDMARDHPGERRFAVFLDLIGVNQLSHASRVLGPAVVDVMVKEAARNFNLLIGDRRKAYHVGIAQLACLAPSQCDEAGFRALLTGASERLRRLGGDAAIGTTAIGVAPFRLGDMPPADAMRIAQGAALDARAAGKLFAFHSSNQDVAYKRSFTLRRDFEEAIRDPRDLSLVYQPRVESASGRGVGVEALLRWTHPKLGPISPGEFIPLIEHSHLAGPTTQWVLEAAAQQVARWWKAGLQLQVSINISAANLRDEDFAGAVERTLTRHAVAPGALELEITETAVMEDADQSMSQLKRLAAAGVRLAIDDFGTGYSSLSYLQRLPVHVVKIDRSFMKDLHLDPRQNSLVTMMVAMAKHLGFRVVAEGVETREVLDLLRATGCDEIQGYLFARPMPAEDIAGWMGAQAPGEDRAGPRPRRRAKAAATFRA